MKGLLNSFLQSFSLGSYFKPKLGHSYDLFQVNHYNGAAAAKLLQSCPTLRPHRRQPPRLLRPWGSPGKNTGVGCHFLLHCMKVKSESEVAQSCPTLSDPMDCSLPGSSAHGMGCHHECANKPRCTTLLLNPTQAACLIVSLQNCVCL